MKLPESVLLVAKGPPEGESCRAGCGDGCKPGTGQTGLDPRACPVLPVELTTHFAVASFFSPVLAGSLLVPTQSMRIGVAM